MEHTSNIITINIMEVKDYSKNLLPLGTKPILKYIDPLLWVYHWEETI
jgi:hypothetical protein